jgi:hypothetical protein
MVTKWWSGKRKRNLGAGGAQGRRKLGQWQVKVECAAQKGKMAIGINLYNLEDDEVQPLDERGEILSPTRGHIVKSVLRIEEVTRSAHPQNNKSEN